MLNNRLSIFQCIGWFSNDFVKNISDAKKSRFGCEAQEISLSCSGDNQILVTKADYGEYSVVSIEHQENVGLSLTNKQSKHIVNR